jgi:CRP-like cAMP-binding protein
MNFIKNIFLLNGLNQAEKAEIISGFSSTVKYKKGDIIYSADDFPNAIGYVVKGKAAAVTNNQNNIHMRTFEAGTCFGVASIFGGDNYYVSTITAKTDIEILFITENELKEIFLKFPKTATNYIEFLSNKIRFLNTKLSVISCNNADDTVLKYLSTVCDSEGNAANLKSMTLLAKTLGLSRATLYRSLESLEKSGIILRENNSIKVIKNEKTN